MSAAASLVLVAARQVCSSVKSSETRGEGRRVRRGVVCVRVRVRVHARASCISGRQCLAMLNPEGRLSLPLSFKREEPIQTSPAYKTRQYTIPIMCIKNHGDDW